MSWFSVVPVAFACLALLFLPGAVLISAMGLRNIAFLAVAPILTVAVVAVTAIVSPYFGVTWSFVPVVVATGVLAVLFLGVRKLPGLRQPLKPWRATYGALRKMAVLVAAGFAIGAGSIALQLHTAFGRPENISQTFDNVFHLNAVRYVLETGSASSLTLTGMTSGDNPPYFYPAAWHGLAALLVQLTGVSVPVAVNVLNLCIAATVWTLGCMFLVRSLAGSKAGAVGAAGALAAGFGSFPILLLDFGVLYPNFLSVSLLPGALACVSLFLGTSRLDGVGPVARYTLAPLAGLGVAIAHPNGAMSLVALSVPLLIASFVMLAVKRRRSGLPQGPTVVAGVALLAALAIVAVMWQFIRPPVEAAGWPPVQTPGQAVGEVLTNSAMQRSPAWSVSILVIVGLIYVLKRPSTAWIAASFLIVAGLFVVVSAGPVGDLRHMLTGVWYNDSYRLAALLPVTGVALAAVGAASLIEGLRDKLGRRSDQRVTGDTWKRSSTVYRMAPIAILAILGVLQAPPMSSPVRSAQNSYAMSPESPLVSVDEMALIAELDEHVPADATIAVNPWTGGAMAFAVADRNTTAKHTFTTYTKAQELLNDKFRDASFDPTVCQAASANNVGYVLDFGAHEVHGGNHGLVGLQIPDGTPGFELIAQQGEAKLFRLTACG